VTSARPRVNRRDICFNLGCRQIAGGGIVL